MAKEKGFNKYIIDNKDVIIEQEYKRTKSFWEQWQCIYCDPYAIGSFARWLESHEKEIKIEHI